MNRFIRVLAIVLGVVALLLAVGWLLLRRPDIPFSVLRERYANAQSRWLPMPGGLEVHYRDQGRRDGPVIIMVHGFSASLHAWEPWVARLGDSYRIVSLDLPGHGLTVAPATYIAGQDSNADLVDQVARRLNLGPYVVVGNSMGGGVAWADAMRHPQDVRGLVLVDSVGVFEPRRGGKGGGGPLIFQVLRNPIGRVILRDIDTRPLAESGLKAAYLDPSLVTRALVSRYVELSRAPGHRDIILNMQSAPRTPVTPAMFRAITAPTLVMHGEQDRLIPLEAGKTLAASIPGALLITYPAVGHVPMEQIPDRSAADLRAFLVGQAATPAGR